MWATSEFQLGEGRLEVFDDFGGDDVEIQFVALRSEFNEREEL